jgi:type IV pilus assembly protein PilO
MAFDIKNVPWYAQVGAFLVVAAAGCGAFVYFWEMPARDEMKGRQQQLAALQTDIAQAQATARQLPQFRADVADLEARLDNLRAVLPEQKDTADLLDRLRIAASQSNITVTHFSPQPLVSKQMHSELPVALTVEGTYHSLAMFFDKVGKLPRIVNITNLDIKGVSRPTPGGPTINATCTATTFILNDMPKSGAKPAAPPVKGA